MASHVPKVLAYITQRDRLLVFRQPQRPDQGIQVPGGSVEPGEALAAAVLREAREETGLGDLAVESYLGSAEYALKVDVGPPHFRHFFHVICQAETQTRWSHYESNRFIGTAPIVFDLWWQPLSDVRLDWEQDAFLGALRRKLGA